MAVEEDQTGNQAQSGQDGSQSGTEGQETASTENGTDTGTSGAEKTETVTRAEFDALTKRMQAADRNRSVAEQELKALRDKDLPAAEKLQRDFTSLQEENARIKQALHDTNLTNAFLANSTYKWKDADAALKLADLSEVTVQDDGKVIGLDSALKKLAETKKFLLEDNEPEKVPGGAPSMGGGATNRGAGSDKSKLKKTFPALGRRG